MGKTGRVNQNYSYEFKLKAVELYLSGCSGGYIQVSKSLGMRSKTQLQNWVKLYQENPELLKTDGRHLGYKDGVKKGRPKKINLDELDKDEQIRILKMEVDVLKKAKALRTIFGER